MRLEKENLCWLLSHNLRLIMYVALQINCRSWPASTGGVSSHRPPEQGGWRPCEIFQSLVLVQLSGITGKRSNGANGHRLSNSNLIKRLSGYIGLWNTKCTTVIWGAASKYNVSVILWIILIWEWNPALPDIFLSRTEPYPRVDLIIPGSLDRIFFLRVRDSVSYTHRTLPTMHAVLFPAGAVERRK